MCSSRLCSYFFFIFVYSCLIKCSHGVVKSSLTFIIDDTASMRQEIEQVKEATDKIFETVYNSKTSQIENFIIVTFNNPDAQLRTVTKDRDEFKKALAEIKVHGGGFCPEYSMKGIKIGLEESLPSSYLYVFTDAASEDYKSFEEIRSLALKKQSKVVFILTGDCGDEDDENYQVFYEIAHYTTGAVFNMEKTGIRAILKYVEETIKGKMHVVYDETLSPGYGKEIKYDIDSCKGSTLISATGEAPKIGDVATGPKGDKIKTNKIFELERVAISSLICNGTGSHIVNVGSDSDTHVIVSAGTNIDIELRFSAFKPSSIIEAVSRPPPDGHSYLSVKLIGDGVKLNSTSILDMEGNVITELPLTLIDEKEQFYVSPSFDPPTTFFRTSTYGYNITDGTLIRRNSSTAIERQPKIPTEKIKSVAPVVTIVGGLKKIVDYDSSLHLICKVHGYPQPDITWVEKHTGIQVPSTVSLFESPYDFISRMYIDKSKKNTGYECKASNALGDSANYIEIETRRRKEKPIINKKTAKVYAKMGTNAEMHCRVTHGIPVPTVSWYFQRMGAKDFTEMKKETNKVIRLIKVQPEQAGSYKCIAKNEVGSDNFVLELQVQYKPKVIKGVGETINVKDGDEVTIKCDIDGVPEPEVKWFFNKNELKNTAKTTISSDHSLKLQATTTDIGFYTCKAVNKLGFDFKYQFVDIHVPVSIFSPKVTTIDVDVGKPAVLPCNADGYPPPEIEWTFQASDLTIPPVEVKSVDLSKSVKLQRVQLKQQGNYTCVARNKYSESNITYELHILAPPNIENWYPYDYFVAVEGDLVFRIQCNTTGRPKPTITWLKDSDIIKHGSKSYDIEEDGTLVIKDINSKLQGSYTCVAKNKKGQASQMYYIKVTDHPADETPSSTLFIEEGKPFELKCDIPHKDTDNLRWYKNRELMGQKEGVLRFPNVVPSDAGLYTCRVSNSAKSRSLTTIIETGSKPTFYYDDQPLYEEVPMELDDYTQLCIDVEGIPPPTYIWKYNGKEIPDATNKEYNVLMEPGSYGLYTCEISNKFGSISASYKIKPKDCFLDITKDFPSEKQPLILSEGIKWTNGQKFTIINGHIHIKKGDYFQFICNTRVSSKLSKAFCIEGTKMEIKGTTFDLSDIKCKKDLSPEMVKTTINCLPGNTENINVGFKVKDQFLNVYEVCFDKDRNIPLFSKHKMSPHHSNAYSESQWFSNDLLAVDIDKMYDCNKQVNDIQSTLGRKLLARNSCCFTKRQLVNYLDLYPGIPASASFFSLNVVPHWSSCNTKNWEDIEKWIRDAIKKADRDMIIYTGVAFNSTLSPDIKLSNGLGGYQIVPQYLWKVIQDPVAFASLAIIQVNVPDLADDTDYDLCYDICHLIEWINNTNLNNMNDGYTFCCTLRSFTTAFHLEAAFDDQMKYTLFEIV